MNEQRIAVLSCGPEDFLTWVQNYSTNPTINAARRSAQFSGPSGQPIRAIMVSSAEQAAGMEFHALKMTAKFRTQFGLSSQLHRDVLPCVKPHA